MKISTLVILVIIIIVAGYFMVRSDGSGVGSETNGDKEAPSVVGDVVKATIKTDKGSIDLELFPEVAPKTVDNFVKLSQDGFYDGITFHRVIEDFMIQGGDPLSKELESGDPRIGTGGPGYMFEDEINPIALGLTANAIQALEDRNYVFNKDLKSLPVDVGAIAMANSGPATNGSQFFIVSTKRQRHLDGLHTVFGRVIEGMDVVQTIEQGDEIKSIEIE